MVVAVFPVHELSLAEGHLGIDLIVDLKITACDFRRTVFVLGDRTRIHIFTLNVPVAAAGTSRKQEADHQKKKEHSIPHHTAYLRPLNRPGSHSR